MALLTNIALFFLCFLPLTLLVGLPFDFYLGPYQQPGAATQIFVWIVVGWPLLVPTVAFIPVAHIALAVARRTGLDPTPQVCRRVAVVVVPLGLLATHLLFWGTVVLSVRLLLTILLPGALLGWIARTPRRSRARRTSGAPASAST